MAAWARERGTRTFALQRYRYPASTPHALPEVGWMDEEAQERLGELGFDTLIIR